MISEQRLKKLDPTDPERWPAQQARGRPAFQLRYGMVIGMLLAMLYDVVLLVIRNDLPLLLSVRHAVQLLLVIVCVAPAAGLIAGRVLWRLGERRFGDALLTREFLGKVDVRVTGEPEVGAPLREPSR